MLPSVDFDAVRAALRREREAQKWSRAKLEEETGISEATIFKIETKWIDPRSRRPYVPSADQLLRLITGLQGISVAEFFARIEIEDKMTQAVTPVGSRSSASEGGQTDDPASRDRLSELEHRVKDYETALNKVRHVAGELVKIAAVRKKGRTAQRHRSSSSGSR
jgi:hypothetical protein